MGFAVAFALLALAPQAAARVTAAVDATGLAASADPARAGGAGEAALSFAPRLRPPLPAARGGLVLDPERIRDAPSPPCVADFCQPRVDVPGIQGLRRRASKTELFVSLLDRAQLEPIASIAWFFVVTGLRVDWTPAAMDESFGATAGGWGNVFVRLRFRVDAWNLPTVPVRPAERMRRERQRQAERWRAEEAERSRRLAGSAPGPGGPGVRVAAGEDAPRQGM